MSPPNAFKESPVSQVIRDGNYFVTGSTIETIFVNRNKTDVLVVHGVTKVSYQTSTTFIRTPFYFRSDLLNNERRKSKEFNS